MLRIIVISLVVANLLLLGFQSDKPAAPPEARPAVPEVRDSGVPTIHLFSEMMQDQGLLSGNRRCFTLGPFHSPEDRDDILERLTGVTTRVSERQTEALVEKGYWVYMPPYASLLEANEALLKLQALGLKDLAIIYDGQWKNSISLGYFMRQENAQRRKKALEDRDYSPKMRIQRQAEPRYWLDYEQQPGAGLIALDMRNRPNDFMQRPVPCPEAEFPETEFTEAEILASGDSGGNPDAPPPAPLETEAPVSAGDGTPDGSAGTGPSARQPDRAENGARDVAPGPGAGQPAGPKTAREPAVAEDEAGETDVAEDGGGETAVAEDEAGETAVAEDGGGETAIAEGGAGETAVAEGGGGETAVAEDGVGATAVAEDRGEGTAAGPDSAAGADQTAEPRAAEITSPKQVVGTGPAHTVSTEPAPPEAATDAGKETAAAGVPGNEPDSGEEKPVDDGKADDSGAPAGDASEQSGGEETGKDSGDGGVHQR